VTKHSLEVLAFRSVKRARDIFLTEPGAPPAPIEVSVKHLKPIHFVAGTHTPHDTSFLTHHKALSASRTHDAALSHSLLHAHGFFLRHGCDCEFALTH
jgi:hypothetical protein